MDDTQAAATPAQAGGVGIAAVERDTGLGKDTLRVWERRYGFPQPLRDAFGERVYPVEQVEHLRLVKRLMDQGQRPGALLLQSIAELNERLAAGPAKVGADDTADWIVPMLKSRDIDPLRAELAQRLARDGLERFVIETVPALNRRIGDGWMAGEIAIFEEHLYTELLQNQLRSSIHALGGRGTRPQILLTTVKDEEHILGLLMVEALLAANGAFALSLGAQTPIADIVGASRAINTDIVALSFSGAYPWRKSRDALIELRAALPERTELWAGGAGLAGRGRGIAGVRIIGALHDIAPTLAEWHASHPERSRY
ncbi:MAG: MerR family transcriptional regulator [Betaproteobacteria bacterium]|nr:MerR family transcriptional regulator [Betaproteobacteria bacterium]